MTSESARAAPSGAAPGPTPPTQVAALAEVVARQRAELDRLRESAANTALVERATGALMARTGRSPDAAREALSRRAKENGRSLLEECWATLGALGGGPGPEGPGPGPDPGDGPDAGDGPGRDAGIAQDRTPASTPGTPDSTGPAPAFAGGPAPDRAEAEARARLARAFLRADGPHGLARVLLKHLGPDTGADAVVLLARQPGGREPELIGHAGIDDADARRWSIVPPLSTGAGPDGPDPGLDLALDLGEARWLEGPADPAHRSPAGEPPAPWGSVAWLPVTADGPPGTDREAAPTHRTTQVARGAQGSETRPVLGVLGVLRRREGPFGPAARQRLTAAARLCAGPLRTLAPRLPEQDLTAGGTVDAVRAVFERLPVAAVLLTPVRTADGATEDFRIAAATAGTADSLGRVGRDLVGLRFLECWPAVAASPLWHGCLGTLASGRTFEGELSARRRTATGPVTAAMSAPRARDTGTGPVEDTRDTRDARDTPDAKDAKDAAESGDSAADAETPHVASVSRVGDALVVSWIRLDPSARQRQRLADVQRLGNLGWADWNLVTGEVTWSAQVFRVFDRDPAGGAVALAGLPALALPEEVSALARAIGLLVREGLPCDLPFRTVARDGGIRHLRVVAEAVCDERGVPVEVHGFVQDLTAQRSAELALVASERANLVQHGVLQSERTVAGRLQEALLPLPSRPVLLSGLRVDIAYLPAQAGLNVGGDWFSAVALPDGDALFVVGDVAGHGIDAVATMALLRFTAKGMVITGSSLTGALTRLNALLLHSRDPLGTATMVLARYSPRERRLTWAQAGHPPPLLLRDGTARYLARPVGMLLGAGDTPRYDEAECLLTPGDRIVLYTDGLIERPGESIDRGLERLARAATTTSVPVPGTPPPDEHRAEPLERLLGALLDPERRDDVCVLDIRLPPDAPA
ncbi:SpoIIE family protein phosphatase [Streptomyces sp. NPDC091281]|uniref:SpoIIE family protein phosphatase n=1 Tax=Streptomyces sp. NPDC091281 TaxID=3365985 RepID=UPI003803EA6F